MRWIVLALSLGTGIVSLLHGAIAMMLSPEGAIQAAEKAGAFTWLTCALLAASAFLALIGGIMAFNRRRFGGILLLAAAAVCFFAHRDARLYGGVYLAGGLLAFFCRRPSGYEDDEYADEDEDFGDDEDDEDENGDWDEENADGDAAEERPGRGSARSVHSFPPGGKPRERAFVIKENKEAYSLDKDGLSKLNEPVRQRMSKVCPVCGASVGIEHKFCYSCGTELRGARSAQPPDERPSEEAPFSIARNTDSSSSDIFFEAEAKPREENFGGGQSGERLEEERFHDEEFHGEEFEEKRFGEERFGGERFGEERFGGKESGRKPFGGEEDGEEDEEDDEFSDAGGRRPRTASQRMEIRSPNKVFVKPISDEHVIPKRPISIDPDNSYQVFSNYTRRRKHRRQSLLRRVLGIALFLAAAGGAAWFLLGLRKAPVEELPFLPPAETLPVAETPAANAPSGDVAVPSEGPARRVDVLAALRIDVPSRGVVTGSNVNVRPDHSTAGAIITKLNQGDRLDVLGQWRGVSGSLSGTWYRIRLGDNREGWIYGQYCQPLDARPVTLPAGYTAELLKTFGAGRVDLPRQLGQPARQSPASMSWPGLTAFLRGDNEVTRLQITSAKYVLQNGVAVGITDEMLYKNAGYPSDYRSGQLLYLESPNQGMSVQIKSGKVQSVTVGNI
jgi:hypothetical protein